MAPGSILLLLELVIHFEEVEELLPVVVLHAIIIIFTSCFNKNFPMRKLIAESVLLF